MEHIHKPNEKLLEMINKIKLMICALFLGFAGIAQETGTNNQGLDITAKDVYDKYIVAIGGEDVIDQVNSIYMMAEANIQGQVLNLETKTTKEGKSSHIISMGGNVVQKQVFNGEEGFVVAMGQKTPLNEEQKIAAKAGANPFPETDASNIVFEGIEPVNGKDAYVILAGENTKNYYDVESGLKIRSVQSISEGGQTMTVSTLFQDYQEVEGVKFPFTIAQTVGPQSFKFHVTEIKVNEGITAADFE